MSTPLFEQEHKIFFQTYKRLTLDIVRGEGCILIDRDGKEYLDCFGGLAVNALGYNHPGVKRAIEDQIGKYIHLSNYYVQEPQVRLAEHLIGVSKFQRIFFTNSGTEAVEGAIKLARKWGARQGKRTLLGLSNSFHGRTMGALSLTERPKYREGYEPFLQNTGHVAFNDVADLQAKVNEETLGVVLECIQGEGGINVVSGEFVNALETLRRKYGFLVIADEIQSGIGRTGKFFAFEHFNFMPDVVVIAKAIGGGLPLGAILGGSRVSDTFTYGVHGTTFGGNPVACAAGRVVMEEVVERGLMKRAEEMGGYLKSGFLEMQRNSPDRIKHVRGFGCMIGVELDREGAPLVEELQHRGILVNCTNTNVLRLLPPYIISREQCDRVLREVGKVLGLAV
ncbi:MAG: acetylornithine/succinylornithine family transaminase [Bacteroidota bacterium]